MNRTREFDVVTGAFGYTGKYITRRLLESGRKVRTITGHPNREHDFGSRVEVAPMNFRDHAGLVRSLQGASVLYNTYWVRFSHGGATFEGAVENSKTLVLAAKEAGVRRIVHLSIANPSLDSRLPYYSGKAQVEKAIMDSGLLYAILRPTVVFGKEDILINNIAWFVRHFPIFAIPGSGQYQLQPIFVEDLADLAIRAANEKHHVVFDAVGPEIFTFEELVRGIADSVNADPKFVHVNPWAALQLLRAMGLLIGDVILTREELEGLTANLLVSAERPAAQTRFSTWLSNNGPSLGRAYSSELQRHYRSA